MRNKKKLLLINPAHEGRQNWDLALQCKALGKRAVTVPLSLPLLAALTPHSWDVEIVDENVKRLRTRHLPDLVGITVLISNYHRALEISEHFRKRGIPVILGGPQITTLQEIEKWSDSIVVGEAELVWPQILADFEKGALKSHYQAEKPCSFQTSPVPRWDLVETSKILACGVQVSRGCRFSCEFCTVRKLFGREQRYRNVEDVVSEIRALPLKMVNFADDNLTANRAYAKELFRQIAPLGITWTCQASVDVAYEPDLVRLMADAGCDSILIGFESLSREALRAAGKYQNKVEKYENAIANIQDAGIHVLAAFIVGFDTDTPETFKEIRDFVQKNKLSYVMLNTLVPYPGSDLHKRLDAEGRLTPIVTNVANGMYPMSTFKNMTQEELFMGVLNTLEDIYSYDSLSKKCLPTLTRDAFQRSAAVEVGIVEKARVMAWMTNHLITRDVSQRNFYKDVLQSIKNNQVDPGAMVPYLLTVESVRDYLHEIRRRASRIVQTLRENDQKYGRR